MMNKGCTEGCKSVALSMVYLEIGAGREEGFTALDTFSLNHIVTKQSTNVHADGGSDLQLRNKLLLRNQPAGLGPRGGANRVKKDRVDVGIGGSLADGVDSCLRLGVLGLARDIAHCISVKLM